MARDSQTDFLGCEQKVPHEQKNANDHDDEAPIEARSHGKHILGLIILENDSKTGRKLMAIQHYWFQYYWLNQQKLELNMGENVIASLVAEIRRIVIWMRVTTLTMMEFGQGELSIRHRAC